MPRRPTCSKGNVERGDDFRWSGRRTTFRGLRGVQRVTRYIVNEVQDVYRLQGGIGDKTVEVIVRQDAA